MERINVSTHATDLIDRFKYPETFGRNHVKTVLSDTHMNLNTWKEKLPCVSAAKAWGVQVLLNDAMSRNINGAYAPVLQKIYLGTDSIFAWAHELVHAADDYKNTLTCSTARTATAYEREEVIASFGGILLLQCLNRYEDMDFNWCFVTIREAHMRHFIIPKHVVPKLCEKYLKETCVRVQLILNTAGYRVC